MGQITQMEMMDVVDYSGNPVVKRRVLRYYTELKQKVANKE